MEINLEYDELILADEEPNLIYQSLWIHKLTHDISTPHTYIGIDPGTRNLGLVFLQGSILYTARMVLAKYDNPVKRALNTQSAMEAIWNEMPYLMGRQLKLCVIEGAAFKGFREVEMAEQRIAMALYWHPKCPTRIIPPRSIRKEIFGNGKIKASDFWAEDLDKHVADALACALLAMQFHEATLAA